MELKKLIIGDTARISSTSPEKFLIKIYRSPLTGINAFGFNNAVVEVGGRKYFVECLGYIFEFLRGTDFEVDEIVIEKPVFGKVSWKGWELEFNKLDFNVLSCKRENRVFLAILGGSNGLVLTNGSIFYKIPVSGLSPLKVLIFSSNHRVRLRLDFNEFFEGITGKSYIESVLALKPSGNVLPVPCPLACKGKINKAEELGEEWHKIYSCKKLYEGLYKEIKLELLSLIKEVMSGKVAEK